MDHARLASFVALLALAACQTPAAAPAVPEVVGFRGPRHDGCFAGGVPRRKPALAWSFACGGPVRSSPIRVDGRIVFGSGDGVLHALDAADGRERWRFAAGGAFDAAAAVAGELVVAQSRDGVLHALEHETGRERWSLALGPDLPFEWDFEFFLSAPAVEGPCLYVGSGAGEVLCVEAASGAVRWRHATGGRVRGSPAVDGGVVYAGSFDGCVYALDARDGHELWKSATRGVTLDSTAAGFDRRSLQSSPCLTPGLVLIGSRDARFYALDRRTGVERWSADHDPSWVVSSPAVVDGRVVVGTSDAHVVECFELETGKLLWSHRTDSASQPSPAIAGGVVVTGDGFGSVLGLDLESGRELWRFATGDAIYSSPLVHEGRIYVGSDDGRLYALEGDLAAPASRALRAVYYDRTVLYRSFAGDRELRTALAAASYETLNRSNVATFLEARIADRVPSVVVFATDAIPTALLATAGDAPALVRRYLDAGGKIVWPGGPPLLYTFDAASGEFVSPTMADLARFRSVLGIDEDGPVEGTSRTEATALGRRWGLPAGWWMAQAPIAPRPGAVEALATDAHGHVSAWVKRYGGAEGTGFIRCWGSELPLPDPSVVLRLAEYGLP